MPQTRRTFFCSAAAAFAARAANAIVRETDARTGREVWRITSGDSVSHSCYFEAQAFTDDERFLVYSSNPSGSRQLYRIDLETGETAQITRCARLASLSYSMHPDGRHVVYMDGDRLSKTEVATARETVVIVLSAALGPGRFHAGRTFSSDGAYTAVGFSDGAGKHGIAMADLRGGKIYKTAAVANGTGGHMLLCPADPYLVTYVRTPDRQNDMQAPMEERARTMIADFRTGRSRAFLTMPYGWRATHEYWDFRGDRFYFHKKRAPGWVPTSICSIKRDGADFETHFTHETFMLGHSTISRDGRYIVTDVQKPGDNPLILIDLATGKHRILCWPDSSVSGGHAKQAHVHPSFSPSGRYVTYTSDRTGTPQVYVVPLASRG